MDKQELITLIIKELRSIPSISAIVLGGSYASGTQRIDSDIDLGIYYLESNLLDIEAIKLTANRLNDKPNPIVTKLGGWGKWVNGGAWLTVRGQRVDFLYRNLGFVEKIVDNCIVGKIESDYGQQPAFGFQSFMYCAEVNICKELYDPQNRIKIIKDKIKKYPRKLKIRIINGFLWDAEFTLHYAKKSISRNENYIVNGCIARISNDLVQTVYALNESYFIGEKKFFKDILVFTIQPKDFLIRLESLNEIQKTLTEYEFIINEMKNLCGDLYTPKFTL